MLGGGVAADFRTRRQGGDGAEQHDAAAALAQQRQTGACAVEGAVEVAAQGRLPGVVAGLRGVAQAMAAGAGEQGVDASESLADALDEAGPRAAAGSVADQHLAAGLGRNPLQRLAASADQHQVASLGGEAPGAGLTDAGSGTGDDDGAQLSHSGTP
ncbi:hypothetical protein D3C80_1307550 [compost metagenome]